MSRLPRHLQYPRYAGYVTLLINWVDNNFRKEDTMRILFSDEKLFDVDGIYNSQNERIWAGIRNEADEKGGIKMKHKFPQKVMIRLRVCSKGVAPFVFFNQGTVDHAEYIQKVLPVVGRCETSCLSSNTKVV